MCNCPPSHSGSLESCCSRQLPRSIDSIRMAEPGSLLPGLNRWTESSWDSCSMAVYQRDSDFDQAACLRGFVSREFGLSDSDPTGSDSRVSVPRPSL